MLKILPVSESRSLILGKRSYRLLRNSSRVGHPSRHEAPHQRLANLPAGLKCVVIHFEGPPRAPVTSASSARQPDEGSKARTTNESLKTPRLGASAVNVEFAHAPSWS